jgi:serine/threonine-protein kinase
MRRLTFAGRNRYPIWSPDGQRVAFQSDREGDLGIFWQRADGNGQAERLTKSDQRTSHVPESWSPRGETFLFTATKDSEVTLWSFSLKDRKTNHISSIQSRLPISPVFSPDGRWLAYTSTETGRSQVFVQPFPNTGTKYQISKSGGHHPLWSPDGRELIYDVTAGISEVLNVTTRPTFIFGNPTMLPRGSIIFAGDTSIRPVDMAPDGRIVGTIDVAQIQYGTSSTQQVRVVLNWFEELKQRVPTR